MAAITFKARVSAIGGTSFTLTPVVGIGTAGAQVDGGVPANGPALSSGITTIVVNSTGAPDTTVIKNVNQVVTVELGLD
jgi:hypothetical protein